MTKFGLSGTQRIATIGNAQVKVCWVTYLLIVALFDEGFDFVDEFHPLPVLERVEGAEVGLDDLGRVALFLDLHKFGLG